MNISPSPAATAAKIRIDGLSKMYGTFTALEPTTLDVQRGEFLTLLGPSGSGKTTLLQMVSGLTPATSGRLRIDGGDWTNRPVHERGMGLVFQHYALFPHMTVEENVLAVAGALRGFFPDSDFVRKDLRSARIHA